MTISVFLADDHAVVRDGLKTLIEIETHFTVVGTAANGREAVRQIQKLKPDMVLMDVSMPELNGIEATRMILDEYPKAKIIILSMHATKEHVHRALQAGAKGYLLKESAGAEVVEALRSVHRGKRYLSEPVSEIILDDYLSGRPVDPACNPLELLSNREREILQLVVEGNSSSKIADILCLSPKTVDTYRSRIMAKIQVKDLPGLVKFAIRNGLISL